MNEPAKPFDYIEEAHVTASDKYYGDRVPLAYFRETIAEAVEALNKLDAIKKAMFYGRDTGVPAPEANAATLAKLPAWISDHPEHDAAAVNVIHAIIGKATEAGELSQALRPQPKAKLSTLLTRLKKSATAFGTMRFCCAPLVRTSAKRSRSTSRSFVVASRTPLPNSTPTIATCSKNEKFLNKGFDSNEGSSYSSYIPAQLCGGPTEGVTTMSFNENANRDALILQWQEATKALAAAKEAESALRAEVLKNAFSFNPEALREGIENVELGAGYKLKAVFKINRSFAGGQEAVEKALQKIEKTGPEGEFIAERLVKWKPELSVTEYKNLPDKFRKLIDEVVTSKEATPALELVAPKSK